MIFEKFLKHTYQFWESSGILGKGLCVLFSCNIFNLIKILRVLRLETKLTVYRALYIIPKHSGGQGVFGPAPIDILEQTNIINIWTRKFNFPNVLIKFKNVQEWELWLEYLLFWIWKMMIYSPMQIFMKRSQNQDLWNKWEFLQKIVQISWIFTEGFMDVFFF